MAGAGSRYVGALIDIEISKFAEEGRVISEFDPAMLSGCSYDLRVGRVVRSRNRGRPHDLKKGDFQFESGECITFETLETIDFDNPLLFGFVVNKHSVLAKGLVHPITKVDPGFKGPLAITIFNWGNISEPIRYGQPLVSLVIYPVIARPERIYGSTQAPSYRQGSLDIASIVNEPAEPLNDEGLARMYGRPVARLYEIVGELQKSIDVGLIKQQNQKRSFWIDLFWKFAVGLFGALVGIAGKAYVDYLNSP